MKALYSKIYTTVGCPPTVVFYLLIIISYKGQAIVPHAEFVQNNKGAFYKIEGKFAISIKIR